MNELINVRDFTEEREAFCWGFIGDNRTGKSVLAHEVAVDWKNAKPNGTIVAHDPQKRFKDVADALIPTNEKNWAWICSEMSDTLIIIDELRMLHPNPKADDGLYALMANRGEYNIDIIYIVHNPSMVLEYLTYYTFRYFMFYTNSKIGGFQKKIPNYTIAHSASVYVNRYVKMFGKGIYPNFPYIIADTKSEELFAVNMDDEFIFNIK